MEFDQSFQKPGAWADKPPPLIVLRGSRSLYLGPSMALSPHRNAVTTVAISLEGEFALRCPAASAARLVKSAAIPGGVAHHLVSNGMMLFAYLDPASPEARRAVTEPIAAGAILPLARETIRLPRIRGDVLALTGRIFAALGCGDDSRGSGALAETLDALDVTPEAFSSVEVAARRAALSVSQFQRLMKRTTGVSFRRYRQVRRMAKVIRCLDDGQTLTQAAYGSGFASSAHLSAAFREMFGLKPSSLIRAGATFVVS